METQDSPTTRLDHYSEDMLPWAHGHQRKAIRDFVQAILDQQTGCQAQLARSFGHQEAAAKQLSRLLHNERLALAMKGAVIRHAVRTDEYHDRAPHSIIGGVSV